MGISRHVATIVTQVEVDQADPAFKNPSKPIGSFMDEEQALKRQEVDGWNCLEDAGRGWRRCVASPLPTRIVEEEAVKTLINAGIIVITVGGGGIPVVSDGQGNLRGVPAVIDKDFAAALLASYCGAEDLIILTGVKKVFLDYGKPSQRALDKITITEAEKYLNEGQFPPGSMGPKIEAGIQFIRNGGKRFYIGLPEDFLDIVNGKAGTVIVPD